MNKFSRSCLTVLAAGALTFGATPVVLAQPAGTETPLATVAPAPGAGIDANATVSLTINKFEGEVGNTSTPLPGVTFLIQRITDIDLTTQQGWADLATRTGAAPGALDAGFTKTTGTDGKITVTNPEVTVGAYLVTEQTLDGYSTAAPFIVTLPFNDPATGDWNYSQTVNPKNQDVRPNKQADDSQATLGGVMGYTINAPVPAGTLDRFNIVDTLQTGLTLDPASVVVATTGAPAITLDAGDYTISTANNTVRVDFTSTGLSKLSNARATDPTLQVTVAFKATVTSIPATGVITNTATVELPNGGTVDTDVVDDDPNTPDQPTSTTFGNLTLTKTGGTAAEMNGAEFQLYQCAPTAADPNKFELLGAPISVASTADGATRSDVLVTNQDTYTGYGIPATSFSGGGTGDIANTYCVLETKAPSGYVRNPEPVKVNYDAATKTFSVTVNNAKDSIIGQLPATGAWGIVLVFLLGLALLARGLYTSYKDNKAQAA
ncbi:fimbrial isopeptide formation D2 domain [Corynebacterium epidermidicanis]|uniref:Fimbrial isopeptide formation D2 domain n=2 Tax=Corynebacterium epidermidicanis TaxID=1050174 RepID=A0A0G3GRV3_9CORY|nr:fimbrial isopeptide formation D2 domain [Corynebacterium epidermidicanis]